MMRRWELFEHVERRKHWRPKATASGTPHQPSFNGVPSVDSATPQQVVSVEACPAIASGPGRVVLGTFHHSAGDVYDVRLSDGSQLGVTARHPVWSVDRGDWVSVGDLEPGETLETLDGPVQFESATPRAEAAPVFNLEVDADHAYRVGEHGVLVHNESPSPCGATNDE